MLETQKKFFDNLAKTEKTSERKSSFANDRIAKIVADFILDGAGVDAKLLEYGCGTGHWTLEFLKMGFEVTAIDFSSESLKVLKEQAKDKGLSNQLTTMEADVNQPLFENKFDRVFCFDLLHHVEDPNLIVSHMTNATKKGGKISVWEPNPLNFWWWIGAPLFVKNYQPKMEREILHCFPWQIKNYLKRSGVGNISLIPIDIFPPISPDRWHGKAAVEDFLFKIPGFSNLAAINLVGGWKK